MLHSRSLSHPMAVCQVAYILENLRLEDELEVQATCGLDLGQSPLTRQSLIDTFCHEGQGSIILMNKVPVAILWWLAVEKEEACFVAMLATSDWKHVGEGVSRLIKKILIPKLSREGFKQAFCLAANCNKTASRWLGWLGFVPCDTSWQQEGEGSLYRDFSFYVYDFCSRKSAQAKPASASSCYSF